jgi:hypothetical protein
MSSFVASLWSLARAVHTRPDARTKDRKSSGFDGVSPHQLQPQLHLLPRNDQPVRRHHKSQVSQSCATRRAPTAMGLRLRPCARAAELHAMSCKRMLLGVSLPILAAIGLAVVLFLARYSRTVTLRDLGNGETQTVSLAFNPHHMDWKVSGEVVGSGFVVLSYVYSNRVSGRFSASGGGDYYESKVSAAFIPEGKEGKVTGKIRASFRFNTWY